jgi:hypothetical protein
LIRLPIIRYGLGEWAVIEHRLFRSGVFLEKLDSAFLVASDLSDGLKPASALLN